MSITINKVLPDQPELFVQLVGLFEEVFEMKNFTPPHQEHLSDLLKRDGFFVFVAQDANGAVIGGLTAYTLIQYYSVRPLVYIFDLAVKANWQRKGIGRNLMDAITSYCRQLGMEEVFVQGDAGDEHAVNFYQTTGGIAENVIHFYYPLHRIS